MAPYTTVTTSVVTEEVQEQDVKEDVKEKMKREQKYYFGEQLKWINIISLGILHAILFWGLFAFKYHLNLRLVAWAIIYGGFGGFGVTAGAHRLWCHRSYKAKLPLRIFLMLCFTASGQNTIFDWVRDHRVHHKFTETDADPHNAARGFFFSHVGWLLMRKHPEVLRRGKEIDMSDVTADPVVKFHLKYYIPLKLLLAFIIPAIVPPLVWGQDWKWSLLAMIVGRWMLLLNFTWFVNSAAHLWGPKPYDKSINPVENITVSFLTMGEGWHNYHHTFPWDYKAAEWGYKMNLTTVYLDIFGKMGLAYDMKQPSRELIDKVAKKHGDGSRHFHAHMEVPEEGLKVE